MSSFVYNLINRHTLMDNLVKPRIRSMFEPENLNTGDPVANGFVSDSVDAAETKSLSPRKQPFVNISSEQKGENASYKDVSGYPHKDENLNHLEPGDLDQPGAPLKEEGNELRSEEQASYQKFNFHIEKQAENDKTYIKVNAHGTKVENLLKKETGTIPGIAKNDDDVVPELRKHQDNDIASNKYESTRANPDTHSFSRPDQTTVSEQTNNVYQKEGTLVGNYNSSAFINRAAPAINTQQPASKKAAIKISIGQIDVRAIAEVQPVLPRNKSVPAARMSLDDYLKIRNSSEK